MFGNTIKVETAEDKAILDEACCVVDEALEQVAEECCVEIEQDPNAAILAKGHPDFYSRYSREERAAWTSAEADAAWDQFDADLDTYHAAYLAVYGVECRDCTC